MIKGLLLGFFCFILFLFLHVIIFYCFKIKRFLVVLKSIFLSFIPVYTLFFLVTPERFLSIMTLRPEIETPSTILFAAIFNFSLGLGFYLFLWLGYCQFFFIVERSISVRFMIEIEDSEDRALSFDKLKEIYNQDDVYIRRLDQLVRNGYLMFRDGKYANTIIGITLANVFKFLKRLLRLGPGG